MSFPSSVDQLYEDLLRQYDLSDPNPEFEASMLETLFHDQRFDWVIKCHEMGFSFSREIFHKIYFTGDRSLYEYFKDHPSFKEYFKRRFSGKMLGAILAGRTDTLDWILSHGFVFESYDILNIKASGDLNLYQWWQKRGSSLEGGMLFASIRANRLDTIRWLVQFFKIKLSHLEYAARLGRMEIILWINSLEVLSFHRIYFTNLWPIAARYEKIELINWLQLNFPLHPEDSSVLTDEVFSKFVKDPDRIDIPITPMHHFYTIREAIRYGQTEILHWIINQEFLQPLWTAGLQKGVWIRIAFKYNSERSVQFLIDEAKTPFHFYYPKMSQRRRRECASLIKEASKD